MELKDKIYNLRIGAGMSKTKIANIIGFTSSSIFNWETGHSRPNKRALLRLATLFDVPVDYLVDDPEPELDVTCYEETKTIVSDWELLQLQEEIINNVKQMHEDIIDGINNAFYNLFK